MLTSKPDRYKYFDVKETKMVRNGMRNVLELHYLLNQYDICGVPWCLYCMLKTRFRKKNDRVWSEGKKVGVMLLFEGHAYIGRVHILK
jgi:hypothetical protein